MHSQDSGDHIQLVEHRCMKRKNPLVSICTITYNHSQYIKECLDGFLMQRTNFQFEVLIHDDASTDGTEEIIREYEAKYPEIIKPIYEKENQWVKGRRGSMVFNLPRSRGKYIALCEGDDYWTDPLKLQKQVDFLEENPDYSLCFHASKTIRNNDPQNFSIIRPRKLPSNRKFEMKHIILGGGGFMATNSMLFLKDRIQGRPEWMNNAPVGDIPLMLILASKGEIGYIDEVMSVYRVMSSSTSWSAAIKHKALRKKHHYAMLNMWTHFDNWSDRRYHRFVFQKKMMININFFVWGFKHFLIK
jgi:glycosyltransferase involved in cell wall biosynthesis